MDAAHLFNNILLLSDQEEEERMNRLFSDLMQDEYQLSVQMKKLLEAGTYIFPALDRKGSTPEPLVRTQDQISAKKHHFSTIPYFHRHDFVEMIYVYKGTCYQYIETKDQRIELKQGDLFLLNQQVLHALYQPNQNDVIIKVIIPPKYLGLDIVGQHSSLGMLSHFLIKSINKSNNAYHYLHYRTQSEPLIRLFIEKMVSEFYQKAQSYEDAICYYIKLLFIELARSPFMLANVHFEMKNHRLQHDHLLHYIKNNIQTITLEQLANEFAYNKCYLSRLISEEFGVGYQKLVESVRMEKIESFIRYTNLSIDEIAERVGYKNAVMIYKKIREKHQITPNELRIQEKKIGEAELR